RAPVPGPPCGRGSGGASPPPSSRRAPSSSGRWGSVARCTPRPRRASRRSPGSAPSPRRGAARGRCRARTSPSSAVGRTTAWAQGTARAVTRRTLCAVVSRLRTMTRWDAGLGKCPGSRLREERFVTASPEDNVYDLVILGAGSGGYAAALRGAQLGLSIALIEADKLGGTCLHRGCIPTKALLHSAEVADTINESAAVGVNSSFEGIDMATVNSYKDAVVGRLYKGLQGLVKAGKIDYITGWGRLTAKDTVEVDGTPYRGRNVLLASGS